MSQRRVTFNESPRTVSHESVEAGEDVKLRFSGSLGRGESITEAASEPGFNFRTAILEGLQSCYEGVKDFFSRGFQAVAEAASSAVRYLDSFTSTEKANRYNLEREEANEERLELLTERAEPQNFQREMEGVQEEIAYYQTQSSNEDIPKGLQQGYKDAIAHLNHVKDYWTADEIAKQRKNAAAIISGAKALLAEVDEIMTAKDGYVAKAQAASSNDEAKGKNLKAVAILEKALEFASTRPNRASAIAHLAQAREAAAAIVRMSVSDFESTTALMADYKEKEERSPSSELKCGYQSARAILKKAFYDPRCTSTLMVQAQEKAAAVIRLSQKAKELNMMLASKKELFQESSEGYRDLKNLYEEVITAMVGEIKDSQSDLASVEEMIKIADRVKTLLERIEVVIEIFETCGDAIYQVSALSSSAEQEWRAIEEKYNELVKMPAKKGLPSVRAVQLCFSGLKAYSSGRVEKTPKRDRISFIIGDTRSALAQLADRLEAFQQKLNLTGNGEFIDEFDDGSVRNSELLQDDNNLLSEEGPMEAIIRDSSQEDSVERRNSIGESDDDWFVRNSELSVNHDQGLRRGFSPSKRVSSES